MAEARGAIIVPKFRGSWEDNVDDYLAQFDRMARANDWDENKKVVISYKGGNERYVSRHF